MKLKHFLLRWKRRRERIVTLKLIKQYGAYHDMRHAADMLLWTLKNGGRKHGYVGCGGRWILYHPTKESFLNWYRGYMSRIINGEKALTKWPN